MELYLIAHNIRATQNIGALFRTADSLGVAKIWLTGYTAGKDHAGVKKTALGAQDMVLSESRLEITELIKELKDKGFRIMGLELDPRATELSQYKNKAEKIALLLGNEVEGIAPYLRDMCDELVYIKQQGGKESMNVSIAAAISVWVLTHAC